MKWTDGTTYFARAVGYARNMFMKSTTGITNVSLSRFTNVKIFSIYLETIHKKHLILYSKVKGSIWGLYCNFFNSVINVTAQ